MSFLKFNHVFGALMLLSLASAFFIPQNISGRARAQVQNIFAPIARPVRLLAGAVHDKFAGEKSVDLASPDHPRDLEQVRRENDQLRQQNASLSRQLENLKELNADRSQLGELRKFCTPFEIFGGDAGQRQSLLLKASSFDGLKAEMPVICPAGLVGRLNIPGAGGASVRLVTDPASRFQAALARFVQNGDRTEFQMLQVQPFVLQGAGRNRMRAGLVNMTELKKAGAREGDWVVLQDPDFPPLLSGARVGRVIQIAPQHEGPGYAEILVEPVVDLMKLNDVMVMNKERSEGSAARGE